MNVIKAKIVIQWTTCRDNSLGWLTQRLYQIIYIFWQVCCVTPALVTKSQKAQVKSTADNNDCFEQMAQAVQTDDIFFERMTMFFARIAQAFQTNANFFAQMAWAVQTDAQSVRTTNAQHTHGYLCENGTL